MHLKPNHYNNYDNRAKITSIFFSPEKGRPLRAPFLWLALMLIIVTVPIVGTWWALQNAHAKGPDLSSLSRTKNSTAMFGPTTGKHRVRPQSFIPGRRLPGLAGHASKQAGRTAISAHFTHTNTTFTSNIVVSSDNTPAPF